jgi:hypothetical protein
MALLAYDNTSSNVVGVHTAEDVRNSFSARGFGTRGVASDIGGVDVVERAMVLVSLVSDYSETYSGVRRAAFYGDPFSTCLPERLFSRNNVFQRLISTCAPDQSTLDVAEQRWFQLAHSSSESLPLSVMGLVFDGINDLLSSHKFHVVDEALRRSELAQMSADAIVVFARAPFMARDRLECWADFVCRAKEELRRRGESDGILSGL